MILSRHRQAQGPPVTSRLCVPPGPSRSASALSAVMTSAMTFSSGRSKLRRAAHDVFAIDGARKRFVFHLLLHRGDVDFMDAFARAHSCHGDDKAAQFIDCIKRFLERSLRVRPPSSQRARARRDRLRRSSPVRAARLRRRRGAPRSRFARGLDGARNPCHAAGRPLPKGQRRRRALGEMPHRIRHGITMFAQALGLNPVVQNGEGAPGRRSQVGFKEVVMRIFRHNGRGRIQIARRMTRPGRLVRRSRSQISRRVAPQDYSRPCALRSPRVADWPASSG